jgi:tRNA U34 5-methylaminomethyl-2-thiouridine-forming methyltransferase MnmC
MSARHEEAANVQTAFRLKKLANGESSMQSLQEQETFHPVIGARREAELLYLEQFALAERCSLTTNHPLVVWDVGLGAAGNSMHLIECWRRNPGRDLHLVSFDLHDDALRFALQHHTNDKTLFPWLIDWNWQEILQEKRRCLTVGNHSLHWEWRLEDFPDLIGKCAGKAKREGSSLAPPEIVFYDAYSPAKCWRMWQLEHWRNMRQVCGENCEIAFHSRATALRVTLLLAGFYVGYGNSIGEKEQTTVAASRLALLKSPLSMDWLKLVKRSTSARPFAGIQYEQAAISEADYVDLNSHPQFYRGI